MDNQSVIILRNNPLIKELEAKIVLNGEKRAHWNDTVRDKIDDLVKQIFGINYYDTLIEQNSGESDEEFDIRSDIHEDTFETNYLEGYELLEYFKTCNIDFSSEYGKKPLSCMEVIYREVELVVKDIKGHLPDPEIGWEREIESKLLKDISRFRRERISL